VVSLSDGEFIRRFLQHVLPKEVQFIRGYGFLTNACWVKASAAFGSDKTLWR